MRSVAVLALSTIGRARASCLIVFMASLLNHWSVGRTRRNGVQ
jgi:hypothetical protein